MSDTGWSVLPWDVVCDQSSEIRHAHEETDRQAEYGVNFYEFINTAEGLESMATRWWAGLSNERKRFYLAREVQPLEDRLAAVRAELETL